MSRRKSLIARSIVRAILTANEDGTPRRKPTFLARIFGMFRLFWVTLQLVRADLFQSLREFWGIKERDYKASFVGKDPRRKDGGLQPLGDMGYSGSTFFRTSDSAYLVKSVPRHFEHSFFKNDMLEPYFGHMRAEPNSLLVRIVDFMQCSYRTIGTFLNLAPSHHIVMENVMYGQDQDPQGGGLKQTWEAWDLKPMSYFYPERDIAGGSLATEATKSKLADKFDDKIHLTLHQAKAFEAQLQKDTKLLADCNAVDYSLFLVRVKADEAPDPAEQPSLGDGNASNAPIPPAEPPFAPPGPPSWRTGVTSSDGKVIYRAAVLDFFWAKHTVHAKAMTGLVNTYNVVDEQGPMSITTTSSDYRKRFLDMCMDIVEVQDARGGDGEAVGPSQ